MADGRFWDLIDSSRKSARGNIAAHDKLLKQRLKRFAPENIVAYQQKLDHLVQAAASDELYDALTDLDEGVGADDDFDDFLHWLVSRGKRVYDEVVESPGKLSKHVRRKRDGSYQFRYTLFGTAHDVYLEKTGHPMPAPKPAKVQPAKHKEQVTKATGDPAWKVAWQATFEENEKQKGIHSIAVSRQAKFVAAAGRNGRVRLWNLTGKHIRDLEVCQPSHLADGGVQQVVIASDATRLVTVTPAPKISTWSLKTGKRLGSIDKLLTFTRVFIASDGNLAATQDDEINVWDLKKHKIRHQLACPSAAWDCDATPNLTCVVGTFGSTIKSWDGRTGEELMSFRGNKKAEFIYVPPTGRYALADRGRGEQMIWDLATGKRVKNEGGIERGEFSPDGRYVASFNYSDETMEVWELESTELVRTFATRGLCGSSAFAGDGTLLAGSKAGHVRQWNVDNGAMLASIQLDACDCVFSDDGKTVFASDGKTVFCLK